MRSFVNGVFFASIAAAGVFVWLTDLKPRARVYMHVAKPEPVLFVDFWFTAWRITAGVFFASLCLVFLALAWYVISKARNADRYIQHESGLMPGIRVNSANLLERLRGINQITVINPNNIGTNDATVRMMRNEVQSLGGREDWTAADQLSVARGVNNIQATAARNGGGMGRGGRGPTQAELLGNAGYFEQRTRREQMRADREQMRIERMQAVDEPEGQAEVRVLEPVHWRTALMQSTAEKFIIGQNEHTGALATFEPRVQLNCGVIGASGTGKTASTGALMALEALRVGYRTIILDPKGGADWQVFEHHAEWHATDRTVICDQIGALIDEHNARMRMTGKGVPSVMALPQPPQPIMVFLEEYGALSDSVRRVSSSMHKSLEGMIDDLMRLARMTDIHMIFLDQYPEHWSGQLFANCKRLVVYKLGPNQGAKVEQYEASKLPDHGEFLIEGTRYKAWHVLPESETTLVRLPRQREQRLLPEFAARTNEMGGEGSATKPPSLPPQNSFANGGSSRENGANDTNDGANVSDWREWAFAWLANNPFARQADLAAAMGNANGKGKEAMRSTAHKFYHEWKAARDE